MEKQVKTRKTEVKTFIIEQFCETCNNGTIIKDDSQQHVWLSNPPKIAVKCTNCNFKDVQSYDDVYPQFSYENVQVDKIIQKDSLDLNQVAFLHKFIEGELSIKITQQDVDRKALKDINYLLTKLVGTKIDIKNSDLDFYQLEHTYYITFFKGYIRSSDYLTNEFNDNIDYSLFDIWFQNLYNLEIHNYNFDYGLLLESLEILHNDNDNEAGNLNMLMSPQPDFEGNKQFVEKKYLNQVNLEDAINILSYEYHLDYKLCKLIDGKDISKDGNYINVKILFQDNKQLFVFYSDKIIPSFNVTSMVEGLVLKEIINQMDIKMSCYVKAYQLGYYIEPINKMIYNER